jgi:hypothetical protein
VAIAWEVNDLTSGGMGMFEVSDLGGALTLADWGAIGLRGQETTGPDGSAKEFQTMANASVPEPSIMLLLGTVLIGLWGFGRKKSRMA